MTTAAPPPIRDLARLASHGTMPDLAQQLKRLGGCTTPIRLDGHRTDLDLATGQILSELRSSDLPAGQLLVRCNNRRASRCPACAEIYRADTYQLITAGLKGGKGTPEEVATHPRVFATFTAPSFGPVHNRPASGRCRCGAAHQEDAPELGSPLDPDTYDYESAVLWNAYAPQIWARFSIYLRREVAKRAGLTQREFADHARLSFAKVAEYQRRGAVHFHAVIRLDGPEGGTAAPPNWATAELLADAIRAAATATEVPGPVLDGRAHSFAFGRQLDIRPIRTADLDGASELTDRAVAAYIAKYATKGAEGATGALDRPVKFLAELARMDITDHARQLVRTAWRLGARPELEDLRLRAWAHMLGFRGHFSTKTRRYSTTLGALRQARAEWRRLQAVIASGEASVPADPTGEDTTLVLAHWTYGGTGLSRGEEWLSAAFTPETRKGEITHE